MNLNELNEALKYVNERIEELESVNIYDIRITNKIEEDVQISLLGDAVTGLLVMYKEERTKLEHYKKFTSRMSFIDYSGVVGGVI